MSYDWYSCTPDIRAFVFHLLRETKEIIKDHLVGFYLHGSLAMGGFNPACSDVDVLAVTREALTVDDKAALARMLLKESSKPFPVEISFMNQEQLQNWNHPSLFDFHYSEYWRNRFEAAFSSGTFIINEKNPGKDADLAAHLMIIKKRGICVEGIPIDEIIPSIPPADYISAIMADFDECAGGIVENPIYSILNLIRVYWYLKEGIISSKEEAGEWGLSALPEDLKPTIQKAVCRYKGEERVAEFEINELITLRDYIKRKSNELLI